MLSIETIRGEPEQVRQALAARNADPEAVERALAIDARRRAAQTRADALKAERNRLGPEIGRRKKAGEDAGELLAQAAALAAQIKEAEAAQAAAERELEQLLLELPNLPLPEVPRGPDASANQVVRTWGSPPRFEFEPLPAHLLAERLGLIDMERGARLAGSGWPLYLGEGALLERALLQWFLDTHTREHGYTEVLAPFAANVETMTGTGQLPKFEGDVYRLRDDPLYLIPTSEVTLTNLYRGEILDGARLPLRLTGYSPCFRREAGAHGQQTRGILRVHQFNKVELVNITAAEDSARAHEEMTAAASVLLERLGLHYRVVLLSSGDMGFAAAKTYDLEVWAPASGRWLECSSISNCTDFQARRMKLRYRDAEGRVQLCHTLNGSGLATPRVYVAALESWQQQDGSIRIPECLRPYLGGRERIGPAPAGG
ncbi:MAG: serine--tRNA ligase 1 [Planctomycetota bacterium]|nr:MAG: serine--tRNA ligase 1 [Planctomycetota bacterium]